MKNDPNPTLPAASPPQLMPWYVHLLGGYTLTALFPWLLVIRQFFCRGQRLKAGITLSVTLFILAGLTLYSIYSWLPWDQLLLIFLAVNLLWSMSAWVLQRKLFGAAPKRYHLAKWRNWIAPISIALLLALGLSVMASFFPIIEERIDMLATKDILNKKVILWDFLQTAPFFLPYGLLIGIWWAGEEDFSPSHILTYLSGLFLFLIVFTLLSMLFFFLFFKGFYEESESTAALVPPGLQGLKKVLYNLQDWDMSYFAFLPLLLGAAPRLRDFWKRSLVILPLFSLCFFTLAFFAPEMWSYTQSQISYEMNSAQVEKKARAHRWAETLLHRFPNHDNWPEIAIRLAHYKYANGDYQAARELYTSIGEKFGESPRFHWETSTARAALSSSTFGSPETSLHISMPLISYESYMRPNWMALLRLLRYYDGEDVPESDTLIKLKKLSKKNDAIKLSPMPTLAELDDISSNLDLELLILPVDIKTIRSLLKAGFPVIQPIYQNFYLLHGIDNSRGLVASSGYHHISQRERNEDWAEVWEILDNQEKRKEKSGKQQERINQQARVELPLSFWGSTLQQDSSPLMGVVYPTEMEGDITTALATEISALEVQSNGYLAALISLNFLNSGDPVKCLEWAQLSRKLISSPLPLHIAHLGNLLWQSREKQAFSKLKLETTLPSLQKVHHYFTAPRTRTFLEEASQQFQTDQEQGRLSWRVRKVHRDFLDPSSPSELKELIASTQREVSFNADHRPYWTKLADFYQLQGQQERELEALEGALLCDTWDKDIALRLTYAYIQNGKREEARNLLTKLPPKEYKNEAHYFFCKASVARWDGKTAKALRLYKKAINMRRYVPLYHLEYGILLLEQGKDEEAYRALDWAASIDVRGEVKTKALGLIQKLQG